MMVHHHHPRVYSKQHSYSHVCITSHPYQDITAVKSHHNVHVTLFIMEHSQRPRRQQSQHIRLGFPGGASNDAAKEDAAKNDAAKEDAANVDATNEEAGQAPGVPNCNANNGEAPTAPGSSSAPKTKKQRNQ